MQTFKPMLCPNKEVFKYTGRALSAAVAVEPQKYLASDKLDGYRAIFKDGEMLSRSLKPIVNHQLQEKFQPLKDLSKKLGIILDGELYSHELTFQEIGSYCRTLDFEDPKVVKKNKGEVLKIPDSLKFHVFDSVDLAVPGLPFWFRSTIAESATLKHRDICEICEQVTITSMTQVQTMYELALNGGYEGLILKHVDSTYKFGRATVKEASCFKVKPFMTFDAQIVDYEQATVVREGAEKKVNELGQSVTSKKKGDRVPTDMIANFIVDFDGADQRVCCSSLTHAERKEIWARRDDLIGKWVEYKGMLVGSKDKVKHPVFVRFRPDKDEE